MEKKYDVFIKDEGSTASLIFVTKKGIAWAKKQGIPNQYSSIPNSVYRCDINGDTQNLKKAVSLLRAGKLKIESELPLFVL